MTTTLDIDLDKLNGADLNNEEIIELAIHIATAENIIPYRRHLKALRDKYNELLEMYSFELTLFQYPDRLDDVNLRKIFVGLEDVGYDPLFYDIINVYQNDPEAGAYILRLSNAFGHEPDENLCQDALHYITESGTVSQQGGNPDPEFCRRFAGTGSAEECEKFTDLIEETRNPLSGPGIEAIQRYLIRRLSQISNYASVPIYIREFDIDMSSIPQIKLLEVDYTQSIEEIAEKLIEETENYGIVIASLPDSVNPRDDAIKKVADELRRIPNEQLEQYLLPYRVNLNHVREIQDNPDLFRIFGPVNPHPNDDYSDLQVYNAEEDEMITDLEKIYGGPRMLLSIEYTADHESDLPSDDWFVGYCQQCLRRIRKRHYAIRRALIGGGWIGCYHSAECVKTNIVLNRGDEDDPESMKIVETELLLNANIAQSLDDIGIAEREGDEPETEFGDEDVIDLLNPPTEVEEDIIAMLSE